MGIVGLSLISLLIKPTNVFAATDCNQVADTEVKYVNATFADINPEGYNSRLRGISAEQYYNLWTNEKKAAYDEQIAWISEDLDYTLSLYEQ